MAALDSSGLRQRTTLKQIGDASLFVSGFFSDSFRRKLVDVDYYATIGGQAYAALSRHENEAFSSAFAELARKFAAFVDVLTEVARPRRALRSRPPPVERWIRTEPRRTAI